ncbi:MAG: TonB family protein [bacterium]|nr:TonB family protein [bacterium]MCP5068265.1 TonB family protein [bacterium]
MTEIRPRHWTAALCVAVILHVGGSVLIARASARAVPEVHTLALTLGAPAGSSERPEPIPAEPLPLPAPPPPDPAPPEPEPSPVPEPAPQLDETVAPMQADAPASPEPLRSTPAPPRSAAPVPATPASAGGMAVGDREDASLEAHYLDVVGRKLARQRRYPRRARVRRLEGVATIRFELDRQGRVLWKRLQRSSGHIVLDREALAMVDRAEPFPPMPDAIDKHTLEFMAPVEFALH